MLTEKELLEVMRHGQAARAAKWQLPVVQKQPPAKRCRTCAHRTQGLYSGPLWDYCLLTYQDCSMQRRRPTAQCDENMSGWTPIPPKPPRRSLLQWLYDTFLRIDNP